jgi:DNA-directed RNA polymerase specialized sigma24 family protein
MQPLAADEIAILDALMIGLSVEEAATVLAIPSPVARRRLARAMAKLDALTPEDAIVRALRQGYCNLMPRASYSAP